ncbi:MAG: hypothetical protein KC646_07935 [Candidatus Cloacimonetes bacterium]|nr:hypothetical protein [Candidatus Cloacimonadota bacterium]
MYKNKKSQDNLVKKAFAFFWYFFMSVEAIYHLFKGLYLTAYLSVYQPFMDLKNALPTERGVVGESLLSADAWLYHFQYGIRGPVMLFTAYLLYKYAQYLNPFKKRSNQRGGNRVHHNKNKNHTPNKPHTMHKPNHNRSRSQNNKSNQTK